MSIIVQTLDALNSRYPDAERQVPVVDVAQCFSDTSAKPKRALKIYFLLVLLIAVAVLFLIFTANENVIEQPLAQEPLALKKDISVPDVAITKIKPVVEQAQLKQASLPVEKIIEVNDADPVETQNDSALTLLTPAWLLAGWNENQIDDYFLSAESWAQALLELDKDTELVVGSVYRYSGNLQHIMQQPELRQKVFVVRGNFKETAAWYLLAIPEEGQAVRVAEEISSRFNMNAFVSTAGSLLKRLSPAGTQDKLSQEEKNVDPLEQVAAMSSLSDYQGIADLMQTVIEQGDYDWRHLYFSGYASLHLGHLDKAEAKLKQALSLNRQYAPLWIQLVVVLQEQARHASALSLLEEAETVHPKYPEIQINKGYSNEALGSYETARSNYRLFMQRTEDLPGYENQKLLVTERIVSLNTQIRGRR